MALKILLADDSMTAQNMGKKILTDAGYDVVAVSNGAAAVKRIPEIHPDIILLDVYMPGYNGLEVCQRVKSAPETANIPVLLTVGKLEPFRPEEGMKARADGMIIKPFEATDLIAVVDKLAERVLAATPHAAASAPPVAEEASVPAYGEIELSEPEPERITVTPEIVSTPAFSDDILDDAIYAPATQVIDAAPVYLPEPTPAAVEPAPILAIEPVADVEPDIINEESLKEKFLNQALQHEDLQHEDLQPEALQHAPAIHEPAILEPEPVTEAPQMPTIELAPVVAEPATEPEVAPEPVVESTPAPLSPLSFEIRLEPLSPAEQEIEFTSAPLAADVKAEPMPELEPTVLAGVEEAPVPAETGLITDMQQALEELPVHYAAPQQEASTPATSEVALPHSPSEPAPDDEFASLVNCVLETQAQAPPDSRVNAALEAIDLAAATPEPPPAQDGHTLAADADFVLMDQPPALAPTSAELAPMIVTENLVAPEPAMEASVPVPKSLAAAVAARLTAVADARPSSGETSTPEGEGAFMRVLREAIARTGVGTEPAAPAPAAQTPPAETEAAPVTSVEPAVAERASIAECVATEPEEAVAPLPPEIPLIAPEVPLRANLALAPNIMADDAVCAAVADTAVPHDSAASPSEMMDKLNHAVAERLVERIIERMKPQLVEEVVHLLRQM